MSTSLMPPRHFFPFPPRRRRVNGSFTATLPLPPFVFFPCGHHAGGPQLYTDDPHEVTCKQCIRSRLMQDLLRAGGGGAVHFSLDELVRRRLVRRTS